LLGDRGVIIVEYLLAEIGVAAMGMSYIPCKSPNYTRADYKIHYKDNDSWLSENIPRQFIGK